MKINRNIPNYLTVIRIFFIPLIIISFYFEDSKLACRLGASAFLVASLTDFFDGYLARKYNLNSKIGTVLDPIADKLLVISMLVMLVKVGKVSEVPCLLILVREFLIASLRGFLSQMNITVNVRKLTKVKTAIQMFSITMLIIGSFGSNIQHLELVGNVFLWISTVLTLTTGYSYIKVCSKHFF